MTLSAKLWMAFVIVVAILVLVGIIVFFLVYRDLLSICPDPCRGD